MDGYKRLGYAIAFQALKDYFDSSTAQKRVIIKDLRSHWMDWITDGLSVQLADRLKSDPKGVERRFKREAEVCKDT